MLLCGIALLITCAIYIPADAGEDRLTVKAETAFLQNYRPGSPLPMRLEFINEGSDRSGELAIETPAVRYRLQLDLPAPTTRVVEFDPVFFHQPPAVTVTITSGGEELFTRRIKINAGPIDDDAFLVGVIGSPARFRDIRDALGKVKLARLLRLPARADEQYDAFDLILVDASDPKSPAKRPAQLDNWLACGGRLLVSLPQDVNAVGPWVSFVHSQIPGKVRHNEWLSSFPFGLGRVIVVRYPDGLRLANQAGRKAFAEEIVKVLDLRPFPRVGPVQPKLYGALRPVVWDDSGQEHLAAMIALYLVLMAVVLIWSGSPRRTWLAASALSLAFAFILSYLLFGARTPLAARSLAVLHTVADDRHARLEIYTGLGTSRRRLDASLDGTARPIFYDWSDPYEIAGDVDLDTNRTSGVRLSRDTWRCFGTWRAVRLQGSLPLGNASLNGEPIRLQDAILIEGDRSITLGAVTSETKLSLPEDAPQLGQARSESLPGNGETAELAARRALLKWWLQRPHPEGRRLIGWFRSERIAPPFALPQPNAPIWVLAVIELKKL